jgi:hypothetical protein
MIFVLFSIRFTLTMIFVLFQVDMSLTKKEFMMAVKLCSDVAVQRGLPNMRLRAAKNFHSKGKDQNLD